MTESLIYDLLTILAAGLLATLVCRQFGISALIGYLLTGVMLGPGILGWVRDESHQIDHFAEAGVFLLLFSIGLEFSLDELVKLGRHFVIGGAVQMSLVAGPVATVLILFGMDWQAAVLIAAATSFSSTVLVFKALAERGQSGPPHGSRAIGILLFQDVALVPLLLLIPLLTGSGEAAGIAQYFALAAISVASVAMIVGLRFCLANWLIPTFAQYRSPEMIVLFTLVCLTAITLTAYRIGLPPAVGAFATGLMFNDNRWSAQIDALVLPFRETFAAIFFVSLGLIFDPATIVGDWAWMTLLLVTMIGWKAVTAGVALLTTGLSPIRALGIGIALAHMGEFSFVLALLGFETGVIDDDTYQRLVAIAVGSLILTPMLTSVGLRMVQSGEVTKESGTAVRRGQAATALASVIGAGPIGRQVASQLEMMGNDVCVIDHSPLNLHAFSAVGLRTVAGDATDRRTLELAGVDACSITVVCVPDDEQAVRIVRAIRELNHRGTLLVRCRYQSNTGRLIRTGANRVVSEEAVASRALMTILSELDS